MEPQVPLPDRNMIIILDGNSIAYRAYHTAPPLSAPDGTPTGAVHIFFTILEKVKSQISPDKIIASFDIGGLTKRHEKLPSYKANREAMPEDLRPQIALIRELLPYAGVDVYAMSGVEADDIIATLARRAAGNVTIVTKDKDLFQLVNETVKIYDDKTASLLGAAETKAKYGVLPEQMLDFLALQGDKSDNIPGVMGIGDKTAAKLINEYGSLDEIYAHVNEQKGKLKENLLRDKVLAYQAKELIALEEITLAEPINAKDDKKLFQELNRLGLRSVAAKLFAGAEHTEEAKQSQTQTLAPIYMGKVEKPVCFIAIEDSLYVTDGKVYEAFNSELHKAKTDSAFYDIKAFYKEIGGDYFAAKDYLLISWLVEPDNGTIHKAKLESIEEFIPRLLSKMEGLDRRLAAMQVDGLYRELELPVARILAEAEKLGIGVNAMQVQNIANILKQKISLVASRLIMRAGYELNLNSPKQLAEYLYDKLKLPTDKKRSTAEDVLKELIISLPEQREILEDILSYREYSKLLSTYTKPLLDAIAEDGRVHTFFKQTGTATGRLSSANPNLQNIPVRTDVGKSIRSAFVPAEGKRLVGLDYSQIELRVLAHLSGDENLKAAFLRNEDIHSLTARKIMGVEEVSPEARRLAKAVNFGIVYGLSAYGLSKDVGITPREAKEFIDGYFGLYSKVKVYIADIIAQTKEHGYCQTILGRKRFFPEIASANPINRGRAERAAINAPIQGSAADIIKLAMLKCDVLIKAETLPAKLLLQIHDELIFEVDADIAESFMTKAKSAMETAIELSVPLAVNAAVGTNWGEI